VRLSAAVLLAGLTVTAACSDDGRDLAEPSAEQTTTTEAPPATASTPSADDTQPAGFETGPDGFTVRVDQFLPGEPIPVAMTCEGEGEEPVVTWQNVPVAAQELALSVTDPDADGFVHWLVVGIDPSLAGLDGADLPPGSTPMVNDAGESAWFGPCPPPGQAHDYVFTLYALAEPSSLDPAGPAADAVSILAGAALATTTVAGTFTTPNE
jgi:hypothetical protein